MKVIHLNGGGEVEVDLKPCPFCGSDAEVIHIGNDYTKSQKIKIKCPKCRIERTDKVINHSIEWLLSKSVDSWNKRDILKVPE